MQNFSIFFTGLIFFYFMILINLGVQTQSLHEDVESILSLLDENNEDSEAKAIALAKKYGEPKKLLLFSEGIKILGLNKRGFIYRLGLVLNIPEPAILDSLLIRDFAQLPEALKNAKLISQEGADEYYMIEPDHEKVLSASPVGHLLPEINFVALEQLPSRNKYIYWDYQGSGPREFQTWKNLADKIERGFGVFGLPKNLLHDGPGLHTIIFHPKARKAALYFFNKLNNKTLGCYEIGLLLGYYEPNVYAFCLGTKRAKKAYPDLTFVEERDAPPPSELDELFLRDGRKQFEDFAEERKEVLFEKIPLR